MKRRDEKRDEVTYISVIGGGFESCRAKPGRRIASRRGV